MEPSVSRIFFYNLFFWLAVSADGRRRNITGQVFIDGNKSISLLHGGSAVEDDFTVTVGAVGNGTFLRAGILRGEFKGRYSVFSGFHGDRDARFAGLIHAAYRVAGFFYSSKRLFNAAVVFIAAVGGLHKSPHTPRDRSFRFP